MEGELLLRSRKAGSVDIVVVEVDVAVNIKDGKVIAEPCVAHLGVLQDSGDCVLLMLVSFRGIESTCIIFTNSHFQKTEITSYMKRISEKKWRKVIIDEDNNYENGNKSILTLSLQ